MMDNQIAGLVVNKICFFIDNSPKAFFNGSNLKGFIPSIANDLMSLTPDIIGALLGASVQNSANASLCKNTRESFADLKARKNFLLYLILGILLLILIIKNLMGYFKITIIYKMNKVDCVMMIIILMKKTIATINYHKKTVYQKTRIKNIKKRRQMNI